MSTNTLEIVEVKEFDTATYEFRSDGLIIIRVKDDSYIDLAETKLQHEFMHTRPDFMPMVAMVYAGKNTNITKEVRDYINTEECRSMIKAEGIVTDSLAHKIILNLIRKIYKVPVNMKMFKEEKDAEEWLLPYLDVKEA